MSSCVEGLTPLTHEALELQRIELPVLDDDGIPACPADQQLRRPRPPWRCFQHLAQTGHVGLERPLRSRRWIVVPEGRDEPIDDPTIVNVDNITVAPGGSTGWHSHPTLGFTVVTSGELTEHVWDGRHRATRLLTAGTAVSTAPSPTTSATTARSRATLTVTQLVPEGVARRVDEPSRPAVRDRATHPHAGRRWLDVRQSAGHGVRTECENGGSDSGQSPR